MFRVDLHVHTSRYSPCAESLHPEKMIIQAKKRKLHGVVITEHDRLWKVEDIQKLQLQTRDIRIYRGVEISSASGHFLVIGIDNLSGIKPDISIEKLIDMIQSCGAAIILVHHHLVYSNLKSPRAVKDLPQLINAIEVVSSLTFDQHQIEAEDIARTRGWTAVGGSDAHHIEQVGTAFTIFKQLPKSEIQLAQAIQLGDCVPGRQYLNISF
ncbi:MAG: CehA/McbA family metallohydrolase [Desulfobacteraceae bacterium]|jgi:predicted metal-dependent phosphoesterase TrpH